MRNTIWQFENYSIHSETDVLKFENNDGVILGYVASNGDMESLLDDLNSGVNPIEEGWEDGIGNTLNINGWREMNK